MIILFRDTSTNYWLNDTTVDCGKNDTINNEEIKKLDVTQDFSLENLKYAFNEENKNDTKQFQKNYKQKNYNYKSRNNNNYVKKYYTHTYNKNINNNSIKNNNTNSNGKNNNTNNTNNNTNNKRYFTYSNSYKNNRW